MHAVRRLMLVLVAVALMTLMVAAPVLASPLGQDVDPVVPTLLDALRLLTTAGGVGAVLSFLLKRSTWFTNLTGDARFWVVFGLSMGVPILAQLILSLVPPETLRQLEPIWQSVANGFSAFLGSQIYFFASAKKTPATPSL